MHESRTTLYFVAAAILLAGLAWLSTPRPITPDEFRDQGESFYPEFVDPNSATTLEVIEFDSLTASPVPFKVTFANGRWTIPSHHNYAADGKDRLAKTAAGVIDLRKDDVRSNNASDHEACGVIDPSDVTASGSGRGTRVTLRGTGDALLADFIIGKPVPQREGFRFVRIPDQKRVYAVRMDVELSTKFGDWIDTDLLQLDRELINRIVIKDYSINEQTLMVDQRDNITLTPSEGVWRADRMRSGQQIDTAVISAMLLALDELAIVGVRPKPAGLSASLKAIEGSASITSQDMYSLREKGFFISRDGQLLSNEGELKVGIASGVTYTLRFGEVAYGIGEALTAGTEAAESTSQPGGENRYLFVTADFDPATVQEPKKPSSRSFDGKADSLLTEKERADKLLADAYDTWQRSVESGKADAEKLNSRFADWYYVIPSAAFDKLHKNRKELIAAQ